MNKNPLAEKIKYLRKKKGLSQVALGELSGVSYKTIQRIERENTNPSGDTLTRIAAALEVPLAQLVEKEKADMFPYIIMVLPLSALLFLINMYLGILVPILVAFVLWYKNVPNVKSIAVKVIVVEILWLIVQMIIVYFTYNQMVDKFAWHGGAKSTNDIQNTFRVQANFVQSVALIILLLKTANLIMIGVITMLAYKKASKNNALI
ncbi:helix-turn-helix domain-containing protein [Zhouia sp. PK063]|uniref:helix-turn-helix domain-containing protein n=1 Tax=Zhouia sp. PK063 TaxID=3373602 RepID=UPI0037BDADC3